MKKNTSLIVLIAFVSGCAVTTKPDTDLGFAEAKNLVEFEGCYENCSDTSNRSISSCLSSKVWPGEFDLNNIPDEIQVKAPSNSILLITAFKDGKEVKKSSFKDGVEFTFEEGRIELAREYIASGATEPGNVFIGLGTSKTTLGLDPEGAGRIEHSISAAGTAFLIIPVAVAGTDISKIRRKGALCHET